MLFFLFGFFFAQYLVFGFLVISRFRFLRMRVFCFLVLKREDSSVWVVEGEMPPLLLIGLPLDIGPPTYEVYFSCLAFGFLSFSSRLFLEPPLVFRIGKFCDELTLGFLCFFFVFGVFSRYPVFGFWVAC